MVEVWAVQVVPPLEVTRMTPPKPEIQHWVVETQSTAVSSSVVPGGVGGVCGVQVVPPLVVATMVSVAPTAHPSLALTNQPPYQTGWEGVVSSVQLWPPLVLIQMYPW